jgi:glycerol-3-phosphate acyltransferase PlsY
LKARRFLLCYAGENKKGILEEKGMEWVELVVYLAFAYLLGAIPTGFLMGKWLKGIDIRQAGSGNIGATNVFRILGPKPGAAVLLLDMAKGFVVVAVLPHFMHDAGSWKPMVGGLLAVLGHDYTCFLKFKGGKGVATSAGVLLGLAPVSTVFAIAVFAVAFGSTRMISVGSLSASLALPLGVWLLAEGGRGPMITWQPVLWLSLVLAAFVWITHIPNIKRILAGTENQLGKPPKDGKGE